MAGLLWGSYTIEATDRVLTTALLEMGHHSTNWQLTVIKTSQDHKCFVNIKQEEFFTIPLKLTLTVFPAYLWIKSNNPDDTVNPANYFNDNVELKVMNKWCFSLEKFECFPENQSAVLSMISDNKFKYSSGHLDVQNMIKKLQNEEGACNTTFKLTLKVDKKYWWCHFHLQHSKERPKFSQHYQFLWETVYLYLCHHKSQLKPASEIWYTCN